MIHTEPGDSQVSGDCGENFYGGLALLVGLIIKLSPWANLPWGGEGRPCQSQVGEGAAKAWYGQLVSLENQFTDQVCALRLSRQIPNFGPIGPWKDCRAARPCHAGGGGGGYCLEFSA